MKDLRHPMKARHDHDRSATYPLILDVPPSPPGSLTNYDLVHGLLFARLLSASDTGVPWREAARTILLREVDADREGARSCWEAHLARAKWLVTTGAKLAACGATPQGDATTDYPAVPIPKAMLVNAANQSR